MQCTVVVTLRDSELELEREVITVIAQPVNGPVVIPEPSATVFIIDRGREFIECISVIVKLAISHRGFFWGRGVGGGGLIRESNWRQVHGRIKTF